MKAFAAALLVVAVSAVAAELPRITVDTNTLSPGQVRVFTLDDSVNVSVSRTGERRHIRVERLGMVNEYVLEPLDGILQVTRKDTGKGIVISAHRIAVDGIPLDTVVFPVPATPSPDDVVSYFVCPKDETRVHVPRGHAGPIFCPVDGTRMKRAKGPTARYFLLQ
ncbi:MAG TPA: hypothetical protein VEU30_12265 [Thermoanaerobaculia bacterium]|nr:hypothetical protein [Thermoanaerobaculia bacterium]